VRRAVDQPAEGIGERQALYNGFGDALGLAVELAVIPVLFALFGLWLDGRFGTRPILMIVFVVLALIGLAARAYYTYNAQMDQHEEGMPWKRRS